MLGLAQNNIDIKQNKTQRNLALNTAVTIRFGMSVFFLKDSWLPQAFKSLCFGEN